MSQAQYGNQPSFGDQDPGSGKRMALAFGLSFLIFFGYMHFYAKKVQPQQASSVLDTKTPSATSASQTPTAEEKEKSVKKLEETTSLPPEQEITLESELVKVTFSTWRGAIKSLTLKQSKLIRGEPVNLIQFQNPNVQFGAISRLGDLPEEALRAYQVLEQGNDFITFEAQYQKIKVQKKFTIKNQFAIELDIKIFNEDDKEIILYHGIDLSLGSLQAANLDMSLRPLEINSFLAGGEGAYLKKSIRKIKERTVEPQELSWATIKSKYFALIVKPIETTACALISEGVEENFKTYYTASLRLDIPSIQPGKTNETKFLLYAGPKDFDLLKSFGFHFENLMDFGGLWGNLSHGLAFALRWLHGLLHNYGLAIILLTILLKMFFYPLSSISLRSMKEMQALKPQLDAIRKKYKDNPKKIQQETMTLYREHNIKPLAGCLPMLVQIPIFIAFYQILMNSIELRGAHFLWIHDLAHADNLFKIGTFYINILPIINGATMFWQQKLTPTDPSQKSLKFMMPIMLTFFFYNLPAGLILYWLVTTLITIFQQYHIQKKS